MGSRVLSTTLYHVLEIGSTGSLTKIPRVRRGRNYYLHFIDEKSDAEEG